MADQDWVRRRLEEILAERGIALPKVDPSILGGDDGADGSFFKDGEAPPKNLLEAMILDLRTYIDSAPRVATAMIETLHAESVVFVSENGDDRRMISRDQVENARTVGKDVLPIIDEILRIVRTNDY